MFNKFFKNFICLMLALFVLTMPVYAYNDLSTGQSLNITAKGAILVDINTDIILYKRYMDVAIRPASMTKMMTLLVAWEQTKDRQNEIVSLTKEMIEVPDGSSSANLNVGDKVSIHDLFYGMMLPSGNDAAKALAYIVSGNEKNFALLMNDKAKELGMNKSSFKNAHGFDEDGHYTTPYDLALLCQVLCENEELIKIFSSVKYTMTVYPKGDMNAPTKQTVYNTNNMINKNSAEYFEGFKGIKTGFTKLAGNCLAGYYEKDGRKMVAVVANCDPTMRDSDMRALLNYGIKTFDTLNLNEIFATKKIVVDLENASLGDESNGQLELYLQHHEESKYITLSKSEGTKIRTFDENTVSIRYPVVSAPVKSGQQVGTVEFVYDNEVIYSAPALASRMVDAEIESPKDLVSLGIKGKIRVSFGFLTSRYFLIPLFSFVALAGFVYGFLLLRKRQVMRVRARQKNGMARRRRSSATRQNNRML
ncbi:MAG: D-alanyl-D-alanine carboxypeptidase [Clostridiales bacterium]|nr:D-alanyl-D-alanine carboxypeptidase [Clostridiales bacterium]